MSHEESVDRLVTGLVREYLYRHGLTEVLHCFDRETGDEEGGKHTRTTTQELVRSLRLSTLYKRNAQSPSPLPSVLDVLSAYLYRGEKSSALPSPASMAPPLPPPTSSFSVGRPVAATSSSVVPARITPAVALPALPLSSLAPPPPPPPPSIPSSVAPAPLHAPPTAATGGGDTFFARLAAAKAAKEAAAAQAPVAAVVPPPPQPPPPQPSAASVPAGGGSFFERLAAAKAAKEKEGLTPSPPATAVIAADNSLPAAAPAPAAVSTSSGGGGFFARLAASKPSPAAAQPPATFAFTAPDGKGFNDRGEYRKYMFETFYSWREQRGTAAKQGGEEGEAGAHGGMKAGGDGTLVLKKAPGSVSGQPFSILDCSHCTLALCDWSETVQVDRCTGVRVFIAASCESVFLRNLEGCEVTVACKQLRTRDCHNCTFYLYAKTEPVVEASSRCTFAPFNGACAGLREAFASAALEPNNNHWDRVFDFSKDDTALPLPHWVTQDPSEWVPWVINDFSDKGEAVNPVPREGGVAQRRQGQNVGQSFDIRTGQAAALKAITEQAGEQALHEVEEEVDEEDFVEEEIVEE